jgi:hypothetical protein
MACTIRLTVEDPKCTQPEVRLRFGGETQLDTALRLNAGERARLGKFLSVGSTAQAQLACGGLNPNSSKSDFRWR